MLGLTVTFTVTIVGIAKVAGGVGLGSDPLRDLAVVVLIVFGVAAAVPDVGAVVERPLAGSRAWAPLRGDGFGRPRRRRRPRIRLHAVRRTDPRRSDLGEPAATGRTLAVGLAYAVGHRRA